MVIAVAKAFYIFCRHCRCKVRPAKHMAMLYCPKCGVPFLPAQIQQAKEAGADTEIHEEDTLTEYLDGPSK